MCLYVPANCLQPELGSSFQIEDYFREVDLPGTPGDVPRDLTRIRALHRKASATILKGFIFDFPQ